MKAIVERPALTSIKICESTCAPVKQVIVDGLAHLLVRNNIEIVNGFSPNVLFAGCARSGQIIEDNIDGLARILGQDPRIRNLIVAGCFSAITGQYAEEDFKQYLRKRTGLHERTRIHQIDINRVGEDVLPILLASAKRGEHLDNLDLMGRGENGIKMYVEDGCTNGCAYCCMHYMNKSVRSLPLQQTLDTIRQTKQRTNAQTLLLAGENLSLYGVDQGGVKLLPKLVRSVDEMAFAEVKLHNLAPQNLTTEIAESIRDAKTVNEVRINLDGTSEKVLKDVGRGGTRQKIADFLGVVRSGGNKPNFVWKTTFVIGLPGETMADLDDGLQFVRDQGGIVDRVQLYDGHKSLPSDQLPGQIREESDRRSRQDYMYQQSVSIMQEEFRRRFAQDVELTVTGRYDRETNTYELAHPFGQVVVRSNGRPLKIGDRVKCGAFSMNVQVSGKDSLILDPIVRAMLVG
ncbi:radical SAM protein [Candidatus Saccharibacteria bacterium]|nr:radical SAM protein [Candidatus Saccharibacteria bacterium]MCL1963217.1 radical SAM protein [Candidatus Saccharibacteria bacterium]